MLREPVAPAAMEWMAELLPGEVVAIDGKTVRRSHDGQAGKRAIHLVKPTL